LASRLPRLKLEGLLLGRVEMSRGRAGEAGNDRQAHRLDRIEEQWSEGGEVRGLARVDRRSGGGPKQRLVSAERDLHRRPGVLFGISAKEGDGGGTDDHRPLAISRQPDEVRHGAEIAGASGGQSPAEVRLLLGAVPTTVGPCSPGEGPVIVAAALGAGQGRLQLLGEVRPRDLEAVIGPAIDDHEGLLDHVAVDAPDRSGVTAAGDLRVEVMLGAAVDGPIVTLEAELVPFAHQSETVAVVTVAAADPLRVHPALQERAVDVDLVADLTVGVIEALAEERRQHVVEQLGPAVIVVAELDTTGVTGGAELDQTSGRQLGRSDHEPEAVDVCRASSLDGSFPRQMSGAGPVAGLATDVEVGPGGGVGPRRRVVALLEVRRVTLGAHPVPVLPVSRPVEPVVGGDPAIGIEVEPALPCDVPGETQRLEPPAGEAHQILLQRGESEGVGDLVLGHLPGRALGPDEEAAVAAVEAGGDAEVLELGAVEVTEHGLLARLLHRPIVVRASPPLVLVPVTVDARSRADEARGGRASCLGRELGG
jgi:hypothetical protein